MKFICSFEVLKYNTIAFAEAKDEDFEHYCMIINAPSVDLATQALALKYMDRVCAINIDQYIVARENYPDPTLELTVDVVISENKL